MYAPYFATICAACHGSDGHEMRSIPPLGKTANMDPWAVMHMIVDGHPDEEMPALRAMGTEAAAGILAYLRALPGAH